MTVIHALNTWGLLCYILDWVSDRVQAKIQSAELKGQIVPGKKKQLSYNK